MSDDLIRRSDAMKIIRERLDSPYMQNIWQQGACLSILRAIENVPTIEAVPKDFHDKTCEAMAKRHTEEIQRLMWVPCSERLPEENEEVLVCDEDGTMEVCDLEMFERGIGLKWADKWGYECWLDVVAWMPLPEPWKGTDDE